MKKEKWTLIEDREDPTGEPEILEDGEQYFALRDENDKCVVSA